VHTPEEVVSEEAVSFEISAFNALSKTASLWAPEMVFCPLIRKNGTPRMPS
jgi:hypothetical protein